MVGPALGAQGNRLDMGGILLLLSAIMFAPLLAGMVAGLAASSHPYRAGLVGAVALQIIADIILWNPLCSRWALGQSDRGPPPQTFRSLRSWAPRSWHIGVPLELLLLAAFFAWVVVRNRQAGNFHSERSVS